MELPIIQNKIFEVRGHKVITESEWEVMRSQIATGSQKHRSATPYAFTEHGVTILASVLRSKRASGMNVAIVRAIIAMKQMISPYNEMTDKLNLMFERLGEHDVQLAQIYNALEIC